MPHPNPERRCRAFALALTFVGSFLLTSCVHRLTGGRVGEAKSIGLSGLNPSAVSVVLVCREDEHCGPEVLRRILTADLLARGIRVVVPSNATRTLSLRCFDLPAQQRNKLPVAPGSRLWYQSRVFAPKIRGSTSNCQAGGPLRLEAALGASQAAEAGTKDSPLRASTAVIDRSEHGLKSAVGSLLDALQ